MQTSAKGIAALTLEEGEVLKSYLCPAGKWTIGVGITSAAGVGKIAPGMVISRAQSQNMLQQALRQSYEPDVAIAMPKAKQQEFDAAVSFHWHTGAIARASWVKLWRTKAGRAAISKSFQQWKKAGGQVLPALSRRRDRELQIMFDGVYRGAPAPYTPPAASAAAIWAMPLSLEEMEAAREAFSKLGYPPDPAPAPTIWIMPARTIQRFQRDHDLTPDGIIGRATLSTLQRRLDAVSKAKPVAFAGAAGGGVAAAPSALPESFDLAASLPPYTDLILLTSLALWAGYLAWRYRDVIAVKVQGQFPKFAKILRSI